MEGLAAVDTLNPFAQTEAETIAWESGIETEACSEGGMDVTSIDNGDSIKVKEVEFGAGATSFEARVASASGGGNIELHLDSENGTTVGTCAIASTGGTTTVGATGGSVSTGGAMIAAGNTFSPAGGSTSGGRGTAVGGQLGAGGSNAAGGWRSSGGFSGAGAASSSDVDADPTGTAAWSDAGGYGCLVAGGRRNSGLLAAFGVLGLLALRSFRRRPETLNQTR